MGVGLRGKSGWGFLFQLLFVPVILLVTVLFTANYLHAAQDNLPPDPAPGSTPAQERTRLLDYGAIIDSLSQDLTREKEGMAADTVQWKILRENFAQRDLKIKEYKIGRAHV